MTGSDGVAVIGLGCRYPDAPSPAALWNTVLGRRRAFRAVPPQRLSADYLGDPAAVDRTYVPQVAVLDGWRFDRARFAIPASVYGATDLTHWLALETAAAALADAGYPGLDVDRRRVGVIIGNSLTGEFTRTAQLRYRLPFLRRVVAAALRDAGADDATAARATAAVDTRILGTFPEPNDETLAGALANTIAGRVCNYFDFGGGGFTVDGACSSSLLAVVAGCRSLMTGEVDLVVAGGVDLSLDPFELVGFARLGALAHGPMRVFDAEPTGFLPGEGCGLVVLVRDGDARAQGLPVYARIEGWGTSSDGTGGITRPEVDGQVRAMTAACAMAGVDPADVGLVEAHGTGTPIGDAVELEGLNRLRGRAPAVLGSIKANIGHTKAAAGAASLIKTVLAVHRRVLPPVTGVRHPHPLLSPDVSGLQIPGEPAPWPAREPRAGVSSMGFGGINCHVVVAGRPGPARRGLPRLERESTGRPGLELLALEASDVPALRALVGTLRDRAPAWSTAELTDVAGSLAASYTGLGAVRCVLVAEDPRQAADAASAADARLGNWPGGPAPLVDERAGVALGRGRPARVGLLFPGQAAPVRARLSGWAADLPVPPLPDGLAIEDGATDTAVMQPAIVRQELAALAWLDRAGLAAAGAVGHSLGELVALVWAGALDPAAALALAGQRGAAMAAHGLPGTGMASVAAGPTALAGLLAGTGLTVACLNGPAQAVVAGAEAELEAFLARARRAGLDGTRLPVSHAFHSPAMEPVAKQLDAVLAEVPLGEIDGPFEGEVFSTVTGAALTAEEDLRALLVRQLVEPVRFTAAAEALAARCDLLVEVGPGTTLTGLARQWLDRPVLATDAGGSERTAALTLAALAAAGAATVRDWRGRRAYRPRALDQVLDVLANPCEAVPLAPAAEPVPPAPAPETRRPAGPGPAAPPEDGDPLALLRSILSARVDLPPEALAADCSPLRDLHVSSLEVRRCVAEVCASLGVRTPDPALSLSDASLAEIAAVVAHQPAAGRDGDAPVAGVRAWAAPFEHRWTPWQPSGARPAAAAQIVELARSEGPAEIAAVLRDLGPRPAGAVVIRHRTHPAAAGLARSLAVEARGLGVTVLDESAGTWPHPEALAAPAGEYRELRVTAGGGLERVATRRRTVAEARPPVLSGGDLLLVTGGAAGVTARCAVALAARHGCGLLVVGRTPGSDPAVIAAVDALRATGVAVSYEACDLTDRSAVADLLAGARERGTVAGLVHGAAVNVPAPLGAVTAESLAAAWAPKVTGVQHVLDLAGDALRLVVGFGSIIGRFGLAGQLDYAVANDAMRVVLEEWAGDHPACRIRVLEWSVWAELGMGLRMEVLDDLRRQGVEPILPALGVDLFLDLVDEAEAPVTTLVAGRFPRAATARLPEPEVHGRFLESLRVHVPGAEVVGDTALSYGDDPYLADHEVDGRGVLPAVLALEALAQHADLLGLPDGPVGFDDVAFPAPIEVPREGSTTLRVATLRDDVAAGPRIPAVVRAGEDGFASDRVRATVGPGSLPAAGTPHSPDGLDADRPSPLYGSALFHRGRFRRVARYDLLTAFRVRAWIRADRDAPWFSSFHDRRLRLGDPGAWDAALHALLPAVPQRLALPVGCDRIDLAGPADGWLHVDAGERSHTDDEWVFDVDVTTPAGEPVARWAGLRLRAVAPRPFPDGLPLDLVGPWLSRLALAAGWARAPECVSGPGERRDGDALRLLADLVGGLVRHTPEGRPVAEGAGVSAAYTDGAVLAGRARGILGLDWQRLADLPGSGETDCLAAADRSLATRIGAELSLPDPGADALVWCAREALRKATGDDGGPLTWERAGPERSALLVAGGLRVLAATQVVAGLGPVGCAVALGEER